jgi:putative transcriptional regulator
MTARSKYKSDVFSSIHGTASALLRVGAITQKTMREFDESCLTKPKAFSAEAIKALRERYHVSQPVFARYLNTTESTIQKWESGANHPGGVALKMLSIVEKHGLEILL